jgi:hypothetical protein
VPEITLVVMAAGIGSRYGGLKQVDPLGPNGEIVIDYSVFDALRSGFSKIVFLIRRDIETAFRDKIGRSVEKRAETVYVFQDLDNLPPGFVVPDGRVKPWGTGHAVLCCRDAVKTPFAVINADDFYGLRSFQALTGHLQQAEDQNGILDGCMAGFQVGNTLSENGSVARGVCYVSPEGFLSRIQERTHIEKDGDGAKFTENGADWVHLSADTTVSMNMWGFTPAIFSELTRRFPIFLDENSSDLLKAEFFLPDVVNQILQDQKVRVRVLPTPEKWFGVTYPADRPAVQKAIRTLVDQGVYPCRLWK